MSPGRRRACTACESGEPPRASVMILLRPALISRSFMVWLALHDRAGPVQLLREDQARELVGQRPWREGEPDVRAFGERVGEPVCTADDEGDIARALACILDERGEGR